MKIASIVPRPVRGAVGIAKSQLQRAYLVGNDRYCPVCEKSTRRFLTMRGRKDSKCPCGSLERHRALWLLFQQRANLFDGRDKKVLHLAPEACTTERLRQKLGRGYITADLMSPRADISLDICDNPFRDNYFDVILCSHVLEHVPDDRKAMREFFRVLKPGGWAIMLVPMSTKPTFEDPSVTDPKERARVFGQWDHVRQYGPDFADRLRESGFNVEVIKTDEIFPAETIQRSRCSYTIPYCTKP